MKFGHRNWHGRRNGHGRRREPGDPPNHRLYRDRENAVFLGVCAGLADYFGFDVKLTRILVAVAAFFFFPSVIALYFILALLLDTDPAEPEDEPEDPVLRRRVRSEPHATLSSVRFRFRELDRRLQRLEKYVTSKRYDLERELDGLRD